MKRAVWLTLGVMLTVPATASAAAKRDYAGYVNPFVGTLQSAPDFGTGGGAGNTFPGAVVPFGMLQWSPDTFPSVENFAGGYSWNDSQMRGFGLTHFSGGGCASFQDVPILPTTAPIDRSPAKRSSSDLEPQYVPSFSHADEEASPGHYRVKLNPDGPQPIGVELAAARRSGVGRITFPEGAPAGVLVNAGGSAMANGSAEVAVDPAASEISGTAESGSFCYQKVRYKLHFVIRFDRPFAEHGTWRDQTLQPGSTAAEDTSTAPLNYTPIPGGPPELPGHPSGTAQAGGYASFAERDVGVRVGISYVSVANARGNLDAEVGERPVDQVRARARAEWNRHLAKVDVRGGSAEDTRVLYTALYHALLHPNVVSDVNGDYMGMDGEKHSLGGGVAKYANFSGWDVYRGQQQLLAWLFPRRAGEIVQSLLIDARESGWLPKWQYAGGQTDVMVGDPADQVIASAYAFGVRNFDAREALAAMVKGATESGRSPNFDYVERQATGDYQRLGYVPHERNNNGGEATVSDTENVWGSASTTLEYANADFAIARLAAMLGDRDTAARFLRRSANWRNLADDGYLKPRYEAGGAFDPDFEPAGTDGYVEGSAAQYRWMVPHDPAGLFDAIGGREAAVRELDGHLAALNTGPKAAQAFLGNEPNLHAPYLFDWLGRPDRAQQVVRQAVLELYDDTPGGLPGNDDGGTLSAWWLWSALGMYPAQPGTDTLALASPLFKRATVRLPRGRKLSIQAPRAAPGAPFAGRLLRNRAVHRRPWLRAAELRRGGRLRWSLGKRPVASWGARPADAPPSFAP